MGHAELVTTLAVYAHLFEDGHAETMAALEALNRPTPTHGDNVIPLHG